MADAEGERVLVNLRPADTPRLSTRCATYFTYLLARAAQRPRGISVSYTLSFAQWYDRSVLRQLTVAGVVSYGCSDSLLNTVLLGRGVHPRT